MQEAPQTDCCAGIRALHPTEIKLKGVFLAGQIFVDKITPPSS